MRLIDTDKLLEKTECLFKDLNSTEDYMGIGYNHGVGDSIAIIKNAPTIEAEPVKHGRWIVVSDGYGNGDAAAHICECSECKDTIWVYKKATRRWNYCPNCGAKMDAEEAETKDEP